MAAHEIGMDVHRAILFFPFQDAAFHVFTRGLDPRVDPLRIELFAKKMDCRVKPGNDSEVAIVFHHRINPP
jgi:hypothetical protein